MTDVESPAATPRITTASEFLLDFHEKGHTPTTFRLYLKSKKGLIDEEVETAMMIHTNWRQLYIANLKGKRSRVQDRKLNASISQSERNPWANLSFIRSNYRKEVTEVIDILLYNERSYCEILNCLWNEYRLDLLELSKKRKIQISPMEVDELFARIPKMVKFHQGFREDVRQGKSIWRIFVEEHSFLGVYADYLRDCWRIVKLMRKYIDDSRLLFNISLVRKRLGLQHQDMMSMLFTPLNRIGRYKDLLDQLLNLADKTQKTEYEILRTASRRIGRLTNYIEKYKFGIANYNEMNKVQLFLDETYKVLAPWRSIIHWGVMFKHTINSPRNISYIFFLFTDLLLWTTNCGRFEDCLELRECEVVPTRAYSKAERSFNVVSNGKRIKTLSLECKTPTERQKWYHVIEKAIVKAKEEVKLMEGLDQAWSKLDGRRSSRCGQAPDDLSQLLSSDIKNWEEVITMLEDDDNLPKLDRSFQSSELINNPWNDYFTQTITLKVQQFKDIDPIDMINSDSETDEKSDVFHLKSSLLTKGRWSQENSLIKFDRDTFGKPVSKNQWDFEDSMVKNTRRRKSKSEASINQQIMEPSSYLTQITIRLETV